jgi:hypothetical protein
VAEVALVLGLLLDPPLGPDAQDDVVDGDLDVLLGIDTRQFGANDLCVAVAVLVDPDELLPAPVPVDAEATSRAAVGGGRQTTSVGTRSSTS